MKTGLAYPHILKSASEPARLENHPRFTVSMLVSMHMNWGWSAEEIAVNFPELTMPEIYSALAYYHDNRDELDSEMKAAAASADDERDDQQMKALHEQLLARKSR